MTIRFIPISEMDSYRKDLYRTSEKINDLDPVCQLLLKLLLEKTFADLSELNELVVGTMTFTDISKHDGFLRLIQLDFLGDYNLLGQPIVFEANDDSFARDK